MANKTPAENQQDTPHTLSELEQELDKDALSPEMVAVESHTDDPPEPRRPAQGERSADKSDSTLDITDADLTEAAHAADQADEQDPLDNNPAMPRTNTLHTESDPNAPKPAFWRRKKFWVSVIVVLIAVAAMAWFIRPARLAMVNFVGLRAEITITTQAQPQEGQAPSVVKNTQIYVNGEPHTTSDKGELRIDVPYGEVTVISAKPGYNEVAETRVIDFDPFFYQLGGNQHDTMQRDIVLQLRAVGVQLVLQTRDWLTERPVTTGTFTAGDIVATPDNNGIVKFVLPPTDDTSIRVRTAFQGSFVDKIFDVALDGSQHEVVFVPFGTHYYTSSQAGAVAVYGAALNGEDNTQVLPPSQQETAALAVTASPNGSHVVVASTRNGQLNSQGALQQQLFIHSTADNNMVAFDVGVWVRFIDWTNDGTLVYVVGEYADGAIRQRLASVNAASGEHHTLGTAPAYGIVRVALQNAIYQVATDPTAEPQQLRTVSVKGGTERHLAHAAAQITQTDAYTFAYQTPDGAWHEYNVNTATPKGSSAPVLPGRVLLASTSADGQYRVAVNQSDGGWAISAHHIASGQDTLLYESPNIRGPLRSVGNAVTFRMVQNGVAADYVVSLTGEPEAKKIVDVLQPLQSYTAVQNYFTFF